MNCYTYDYKSKYELNTLVYLPEDYNNTDEFPLIISLHGSGERGNDLELLKRYGIHKVLRQRNDFPFIVVSPQCPENEIWEMQFNSLKNLLDDILQNYRVDRSRIFLTGYSLGGYGTWNFALLYPHIFTAIVPISGGVMLPHKLDALKHIPIWTAHGEKDSIVNINETTRIVDYLRDKNDRLVFKLYKDGGHEICTKAYQDEDLYEWLMKQCKLVEY